MAKKRQTNKLAERLIDRGAWLVEETDRLLDQAGPFLGRQGDKIIDVCGDFVVKFDEGEDVVAWFLGKTFVHAARKWHDMHIGLQKHRKEIVKHFAIGCVVIVGAVGVYATSIDYEYAYNGRTLGIVKEQRDVLEILDLVSEALTQEYGSSIVIDPETDITFKPVIKFGKEIDDPDTVLRRFTYMGDIQTQAYAIMVNGERMITVENEAIAQEVLDSILDSYIKGDRSDYESVGFTEDIKIEAYNTTLANVSSKAAATKKLKSGGQQELTYEAVAGDTLYGICNKLGVSLSELKEMNPRIKDTMVLHVGDKFVTQQEVPLLTVETVEIATFAESIDYETKHKESSAYYKGETIVTQAGEKGKARVTARLTKQNGKTVERKDLSVKTIKEPVSKIVIKGTKALPPTKGTGRFIRPVSVSVYRGYGPRWGRMHYGLDYAAPTGTTIRAADGGTVTKAGWSGAYGYRIVIDHGGGFKTLYAHCSSISVSAGQRVYQGQKIGAVGNTGRSTGAHCHFEIFKNGANVNPASYL